MFIQVECVCNSVKFYRDVGKFLMLKPIVTVLYPFYWCYSVLFDDCLFMYKICRLFASRKIDIIVIIMFTFRDTGGFHKINVPLKILNYFKDFNSWFFYLGIKLVHVNESELHSTQKIPWMDRLVNKVDFLSSHKY